MNNSLKSLDFIRLTVFLALTALLSGCEAPEQRAGDITLVSGVAASNSASTPAPSPALQPASGVPKYRIVNVVRTKPECEGELCPSITFKRLSFEGYERFNGFLERSLLSIALVDTSESKTFRSLSALANAFWKTAEDRYEIVLGAEVTRATPSIVVIELQSYAYTGGAHGMSTTQYINWTPTQDKILTLKDLILPGRMRAFEAVLKKQHSKWLETNEFAQPDKAEYIKTWPFQFSDNAALMSDGIAVTFGHYVLGPYALGMPTILVPFSELKGIINSGLLSKLKIQG